MTCLYVTENALSLKLREGYFIVEDKNKEVMQKVPQETVDSVVLLGRINLSGRCIEELLRKGIPVSFYSNQDHYHGKLESTIHFNAKRLKKQVFLSEDDNFRLGFARNTLYAKIHNQYILLQRYARFYGVNLSYEIEQMKQLKNKVVVAESVEQAMGYEGNAAKYYFQALSKCVDPDFTFEGRSKRPPKDKFNAMISFGYTMLLYEIYGEIASRGLSPYIGFVHADKEQHPALASDLLEEWRAVIVDSTVMALIQTKTIKPEHFYFNEQIEGVYLTKEGMSLFISKLENKMRTKVKYLSYLEGPSTFRRAIYWQAVNLVKAIEEDDYLQYKPLMIR